MSKKKVFWGIFLAVVLIGCFAVMFLAQKKPLERENDTEFASGSGIQIEDITDLKVESLYKLCKVWGYAKYRHPAVVDGTLNWDAELFRVMPKVLEAQTAEEANEVLYLWLEQFPFSIEESEDKKVWLQVQDELGFSSRDNTWIQNKDFLGENLCAYLKKLSETFISERTNAYAAFSENTPYVDFENEKAMPFKPEDDGVKLLSLFRFWNMYEYYSPNVEITKKDWDEVLKEAIPQMIEADTYRDYVLTIASVTVETADAHIKITDKEGTLLYYYGEYFLPCNIKSIDGQIVVAQVALNEKQLQPGDIIEAIDGVTIAQRIEELSRYIVLSEPDKFEVRLAANLLEAEHEQAEVQIIRDGEKISLQVQTQKEPLEFKNPYKNGLMENKQIGYIDPSALGSDGEVEKLMEDFADTKGIIVDLRKYPSVFLPYLLGEYITPEAKQFVKMTFPNRAIPGSFYYTDDLYSGAGVMEKLGNKKRYPRYEGKVMLLMDETSMSQSEFTIMALRQSPNATVVGSPSIGADGNIVKLSLPGGIRMAITGLGVYTPDGKQTQRVGLEPDVECWPTVEGLRDGRDELVEKAIELIMQ